ncbi:Transcriptional regulatory protein ZraR [Planctomycetales bacterium 10988]|nr:Transcriptional regulatory protein ZraR [Planctomycetales bacterium 10988]
MKSWLRNLLFLIGVATVLYSIAVFFHITFSYDLRIYAALGDSAPVGNPMGVRIDAEELDSEDQASWRGKVRPQSGDLLIELAGRPVPTFEHFAREHAKLKRASFPEGTRVLSDGADPTEQTDQAPLYLIGQGTQQERWVRIKFLQANEVGEKDPDFQIAWIKLRPFPARLVLISLAWFLLKMIIFVLGAFVLWRRPTDGSARIFFLHCSVTVVAYMGCFHWINLAGNPFLFYPFVICAMLVPPLTSYLYLRFPSPHALVERWPILTPLLLFSIPTVWIVSVLSQLVWLNRLMTTDADPAFVSETLATAAWLGYTYLPMATFLFGTGLLVLIHRYFTATVPSERNQVAWILVAGILALFPLGMVLYIAYARPIEFRLGWYTQPMMFVASILFSSAYAVSITKYKLMRAGRLLNRGFLYFSVSFLAMALFCLQLALFTLWTGTENFEWINVLLVGLTSMFLLVLLGFWGDRFQKRSELRFYREKYQLDRAMRKLSRAVDRLVEPSQLLDQMLHSARDAVSAKGGLVYFRDEEEAIYLCVARVGEVHGPDQLSTEAPLIEQLNESSLLDFSRSETNLSPTRLPSLRVLEWGQIALALEVQESLQGIVILGEKEDELGEYTTEDHNFLIALIRTTCLALQGAQGHRTIAGLREDLQQKVEEIAEQRQQILFLQGELSGRMIEGENAPEELLSQEKDFKGTPLRHELRGSSPAVRRLLNDISKVAQSQTSVLIRGESGTGKELVAKAIHQNSARAEGPFVPVHCAALSAGLLESELFGHVKGAFTGADQEKIGRFELADCGTLFLDEIGDIDAATQVKLLRVLQEQSFEKVGGTKSIRVDVRLLAATHRNLEQLIREGKFREDLFYRLNVISLWTPPLRERGDDIVELALHFLRLYSSRTGKHISRISPPALEACLQYAWPGNVRQLENAIERAVVLAEGESLSLEDFPPEILRPSQPLTPAGTSPPAAVRSVQNQHPAVTSSAANLTNQIEAVEKQQLMDALSSCQGNKSKTARMLGIPRSTLFSKLKKHGIA